MKSKLKLLRSLAVGTLALMMTNGVVAQSQTDSETLLKTVYNNGTVMGDGSGAPSKDVYYYGADNKVLRRIVSNAATDSTWAPYQYYRYTSTTDADGNVTTQEISRKHKPGAGSYDDSQRYWDDYTPNTMKYETYNKKGQLIYTKDTFNGDSAFFNYDGDNLVEKIIYYYASGALFGKKKSVEKYSDFVEGKVNLPQTMTASSRYSGSATWSEMKYDADGKLIEKITYKAEVGDQNSDGQYYPIGKGVAKQKETWEYNADGDLIVHKTDKWKTDAFVDSKKTTYDIVGNKTTVANFEWRKNEQGEYVWGRDGISKTYEYAEYQAASAMKNLTVERSLTDMKVYVLTADAPAVTAGMRFDVYRDGELRGQMALNAATRRYEYTDTAVYNGLHDWFVQTVDETNGAELNISNAVEIIVNEKLNPVTVTRVVKNSYDAASDYHNVTIEWDPVTTEGATLIGYNFYTNVVNISQSSPQNPTPIVDTQYSVKWQGSIITEERRTKAYYVEAVYDMDRVMSEKYEVVLKETADEGGTSDAAVYLNEKFNKGVPASLKLVNNDGMNPLPSAFKTNYIPVANWFIAEANDADSTVLMSTSRRTDATKPTSNWFVTANPMTITPDGGVWLRWDARSIHYDHRESYRVVVFTKQDMSDMKEVFSTDGEEYTWTTRMVCLDDYEDQSIYVAFEHNSTGKYLLAIDNLFCGQFAETKLDAENMGQHFIGATTETAVKGKIINQGRSITMKEVKLTVGDKTYTMPTTAYLQTGKELEYSINIPVENGKRYDYTVAAVDNEGNETVVLTDYVSCSNYKRTMLVEKFTGMWCNSCPAATPYVHRLEEKYGDEVAVVEIHGNTIGRDPLSQEAYCTAATIMNYPTVRINRNVEQQSGWGVETYFSKAVETPVDAKTEAVAAWTEDGQLQVKTTVQFAAATENADSAYRVGYIITENGLRNDKFYQENNCTTIGAEEYRFLPSRILGATLLEYNNVARGAETEEGLALYGSFNGVKGNLPKSFEARKDYQITATLPVPSTVTNKENISVVAVLYKYSKVVNADKVETIADKADEPTPEVKPEIGAFAMTIPETMLEYQIAHVSENGDWACGVTNSGVFSGWAWDLTSGEYIELTPVGVTSMAIQVSNEGVVAGTFLDNKATANGAAMESAGYWKQGKWYHLDTSLADNVLNYDGAATANAISPNGRYIGGQAVINKVYTPVIWDMSNGGKMTALPNAEAKQKQGAVLGVSDEGTAAGWTYKTIKRPGMSDKTNRTAAIWTPELVTPDTTAAGVEYYAEARFSPNGKKAIAYRTIYDVETGEKTKIDLGGLFEAVIFGVCNDGSVYGQYVGNDMVSSGGFILTADGKFHDASQYLAARGADVTRYRVAQVVSISADMNTFAVMAFDSQFTGAAEGAYRVIPVIFKLNENITTREPAGVKAMVLEGANAVRLTWNKPLVGAAAVTAYEILCDGATVATVGADKLNFVDTNVADGDHAYTVKALYGNTVSEPTKAVYVTIAPVALAAPASVMALQARVNDVRLLWNEPASTLPSLQYHNDDDDLSGIGWANYTIECAVRYTADMLAPYGEGAKIEGATFAPMSKRMGWEINVYDVNNQLQPLYTQKVDDSKIVYGELNTVMFDTPFAIPAGKDVIIAAKAISDDIATQSSGNVLGRVTGKKVIGYTDLFRRMSNGTAPSDNFFSMYTLSMSNPDVAAEDNTTWPVAAIISNAANTDKTVTGYQIWEGENSVAATETAGYTVKGVSEGEHTYAIAATYADGTSEKVTATVNVKNNYSALNISNLKAEADGFKATLTWNAPVNDDATVVSYATGDVPANGLVGSAEYNYSYTVAHAYSGKMLKTFNGYGIKAFRFFPMGKAYFAFYLYKNNEEIVYKEVNDGEYTIGQWNTVMLDEKIELDPAAEYILALECFEPAPEVAPIALDGYATHAYSGDLFKQGDGDFEALSNNEDGITGNWMIGMVVAGEDEPLPLAGYKVYQQQLLFGEKLLTSAPITETSYLFNAPTEDIMDYTLRVAPVYEAPIGEQQGEKIKVSITGAAGIDNITAADIISCTVYTLDGVKVAETKGDDVNLAPDVYMMKIKTVKGEYTKKVVIK